MKNEQIIDYLKTGQYSKAGEKLYGYFPVVRKLVLKNSGTGQDAEDVYQEALLILIKKVQDGNFVLRSSLNTYLYSVCRFLWNDQLKKKNKRVETDFEKNQIQLGAEEAEEYRNADADSRLAEKAFGLLGEKCRLLLQLFYFKKISLKEIAATLGLGSEQVAKNQKYRCLEKAKLHFKTLKTSSHE